MVLDLCKDKNVRVSAAYKRSTERLIKQTGTGIA